VAGAIKRLTCPECGQTMATAVWRIFGGLRVYTLDGFLLSPMSDDPLLQTAEQWLASATCRELVTALPGKVNPAHEGPGGYVLTCNTQLAPTISLPSGGSSVTADRGLSINGWVPLCI
jgi:hypothetical protein